MVSFRGMHSSIRQYVKGKSNLWGMKIWAGCSSSGILWDFAVFEGGTGKKYLNWHWRWPFWSSYVKFFHQTKTTRYLRTISFSSEQLVLKLFQWLIYFVGTLRSNRLGCCQLEDQKSLAMRGRHLLMPGCRKRKRWPLSSGMTTNLLSWSHPAVPLRLKTKLDTRAKEWFGFFLFLKTDRPHIVKGYNTLMGGTHLMHGTSAIWVCRGGIFTCSGKPSYWGLH